MKSNMMIKRPVKKLLSLSLNSIKNFLRKKIHYLFYKGKTNLKIFFFSYFFKIKRFILIKKTNILFFYYLLVYFKKRENIKYNFKNFNFNKKSSFFKVFYSFFYFKNFSFKISPLIFELFFQCFKTISSKDVMMNFYMFNDQFSIKNCKIKIFYMITQIRMILSGLTETLKIKFIKNIISICKNYTSKTFLSHLLYYQRFFWKIYRIYSSKIFPTKKIIKRNIIFHNNCLSGIYTIEKMNTANKFNIYEFCAKSLSIKKKSFEKNKYMFFFSILLNKNSDYDNLKKRNIFTHEEISSFITTKIKLIFFSLCIKNGSRIFRNKLKLLNEVLKKKKNILFIKQNLMYIIYYFRKLINRNFTIKIFRSFFYIILNTLKIKQIAEKKVIAFTKIHRQDDLINLKINFSFISKIISENNRKINLNKKKSICKIFFQNKFEKLEDCFFDKGKIIKTDNKLVQAFFFFSNKKYANSLGAVLKFVLNFPIDYCTNLINLNTRLINFLEK